MPSSTVKQLARAKACSTVKQLARAKALMVPTEVDPEQGLSAPRSTECSIVRPAERTFGTHEPPAKFPSTPQACWPFSLYPSSHAKSQMAPVVPSQAAAACSIRVPPVQA